MKVAAHITYFHSPERLGFLKKVVEGLLKIDHDIFIYIYTNKKLKSYFGHSKVKVLIFGYKKILIARFPKNSIVDKIGLKSLVNPFYLTWECRSFIEKMQDDFDVQLYLEDDILFTEENFHYWKEHKDDVLSNGYNLGFLRIEKDNHTRDLLTDVTWPLTEIVIMGEKKYLVNNINPYCGFWIYDKQELKNFIKSKEWNFDFGGYDMRAQSAVGWHGINMKRYKSSIIPLVIKNNRLSTPTGSSVHHLPNNYIGKGRYCTIEFPITLPEN